MTADSSMLALASDVVPFVLAAVCGLAIGWWLLWDDDDV